MPHDFCHKPDTCSCGCSAEHEEESLALVDPCGQKTHENEHNCSCGCSCEHEERASVSGCSCGCSCVSDPCDDDDHGCGCGCGCEHEEEDGKVLFLRILCAAAALPLSHYLGGNLAVLGIGYLIAAYPVLRQAVKNILHGEVFDEMFLMSIASLGAIAIGEYAEGIAVLALYQLGEYLQDKAVDSSRRSIRALMDIRPDSAKVVTEQGIVTMRAEEVAVGSTIEIHAGEKIPLDGLILGGTSTVDTSALTGESLPREVGVGSEVFSGCVNLTATLRVQVTKPYGEDNASRILALVEGAQAKKAKSEQFIRRFAKVYTPIVVILALALAFVPPLLGLGALSDFIKRALNFLVVSCPCALVISIPLTFFSGLGCASSHGILVKGSNYLETLGAVRVAAFDKTGTLTQGKFSLRALHPSNCSEQELLMLAAYAESQSNHPIARSIVTAYGSPIDSQRMTAVAERPGSGVSALLDGKALLAGNASFLTESGIEIAGNTGNATTVHVAYDGSYCGAIELLDLPKPDAGPAIAELRALGVETIVMLSGDKRETAESIGRELKLTSAYGELTPKEKLDALEALKKQQNEKERILYVGDGINDTPVLAAADVGIAMGAFGTDAAMETADVVIMSDEVGKVAEAIKISRKTSKIAKQNIAFSLCVKVLVLLLSTLGYVNLWAAVFADVGICMLTILNALRAMK